MFDVISVPSVGDVRPAAPSRAPWLQPAAGAPRYCIHRWSTKCQQSTVSLRTTAMAAPTAHRTGRAARTFVLRAPLSSMVAPYAAVIPIVSGIKGAAIFIPVTNAVEALQIESRGSSPNDDAALGRHQERWHTLAARDRIDRRHRSVRHSVR